MKPTDLRLPLLALSCLPLTSAPAFDEAAAVPAYELEPLLVQTTPFFDDFSEGSQFSVDTRAWKPSIALDAFEARVPNFFAADSGSRGYGDIVSVRGLSNTLFFSSPAVAFYIDDVPVGATFAAARELSDLESATVFRGPRGTAYGQNSQAGLVNAYTAGPTEFWRGRAAASYGSYESRSLEAFLSGPLGSGDGPFSFSAFGFFNARDGYVDNLTLGTETDDREAYGGRLKLAYRPDSEWEAILSLELDRFDDGGQPLVPLASGPEAFQVTSDLLGQTNITRHLQSVRLIRDFGAYTFKSITAHQYWELDPSTTDLDLTATPLFTSTIRQDRRQWSQELRLSSDASPDGASWQLGLFGLYARNDNDSVRTIPAPEQTVYSIEEYNLAVYANTTIPFAKNLDLRVGVRADVTHSELERAKTGTVAFDESATFYNGAADLGLEYTATEQLTLFTRTAIAYKPGGFSGFVAQPLARYDNERSYHAEAGARWRNRAETFTAALTAFYIRSRNYQFERSVPPPSTDFFLVNADSAISHGVEAELAWRPFRPLLLRGATGYTDARFDDFQDPFTGAVLDDNRLPFTPRYTVRLESRLELPRGFFVEGGVSAYGETYYDETNTTAFRQGEYAIVDARIGYEQDRYGAALYARNLFDRAYYTSITPGVSVAPPFGAGSVGEPQVFGISVWARF
jgi:iron complex outermembrane receptor protein